MDFNYGLGSWKVLCHKTPVLNFCDFYVITPWGGKRHIESFDKNDIQRLFILSGLASRSSNRDHLITGISDGTSSQNITEVHHHQYLLSLASLAD